MFWQRNEKPGGSADDFENNGDAKIATQKILKIKE
jgi:hypothetical protein